MLVLKHNTSCTSFHLNWSKCSNWNLHVVSMSKFEARETTPQGSSSDCWTWTQPHFFLGSPRWTSPHQRGLGAATEWRFRNHRSWYPSSRSLQGWDASSAGRFALGLGSLSIALSRLTSCTFRYSTGAALSLCVCACILGFALLLCAQLQDSRVGMTWSFIQAYHMLMARNCFPGFLRVVLWNGEPLLITLQLLLFLGHQQPFLRLCHHYKLLMTPLACTMRQTGTWSFLYFAKVVIKVHFWCQGSRVLRYTLTSFTLPHWPSRSLCHEQNHIITIHQNAF